MSEFKSAIVTGASSGIGKATALELARSGYRVMLAARRIDRLAEWAATLASEGHTVAYMQTDVTSYSEMERLAEYTIQQFHSIDVLVNNAGIMPLSMLSKRKVDEWDRMIDVNIKGVLYGIGAVLPYMEKQKSGHIVNIASVAGHHVNPGMAVYSGTKFAVRAITEGLRKEMSVASNIRTTIVSPGMTMTELSQTITDLEYLEQLRSRYSLSSPLQPEDIAKAIAYAVSQPGYVDVNEIVIRPTEQGA